MTWVYTLLIAPFETIGFMRTALAACIALALANGAIGTLLVLRRMSLDGDALGHAIMPGAAVGFLYGGPSPAWMSLGGLCSGLAVAALSAVIVRGSPHHDSGARSRPETALIVFYLVALSLGVLLVAWRGGNADLVRVLFGTVLSIDRSSLIRIATASSVILLVIAALYRPLAVDSFDPLFLRAIGAHAPYRAVFVTLVVFALVASFEAFGTLLAVGPVLLPAAAVRCWRCGAAVSMALAAGFGLTASIAGLLISYHGNLPSGPAIVLVNGMLFGVSLVAAGLGRNLSVRLD